MLKYQKGITLISLTITIIILMILSSVVIFTSIDLMNSSRTRNYITTMSLVKVEIEKIFEDFEFENDVSNMNAAGIDTTKLKINGAEKISNMTDELPTEIVNKLSANEKILLLDAIQKAKNPSDQDINGDGVINSNDIEVDVDNLWYIWNKAVLDKLKIDYSSIIEADQYFIINYATGEIILPNGTDAGVDGIEDIYSLTGLKNLS